MNEEKEILNELKLDINSLKSNENEIDTHILISIENVKIILNYIDKLQKQLYQLKEVDKKICNEELITKDKYQEILKENEELKGIKTELQ